MSNFLARLVERQWGQVATVQPRMQSMFAAVSDAPSFQVVDEGVVVQPPANWQQESSTRHVEPESKQRSSDPEQQPSQQRSVSPSAPLVHETLLQPAARPLLQSATSVQATAHTHVERQTPPARLAVPPMMMHPTPEVAARVQPTLMQSKSAQAQDAADVQPLTETIRIAVPALVEPRAPDPISSQQQIAAPASLLVAAPATERAPRAEPHVVEPPVHVTIGRIEVTAVTAAPAPKRVASSRQSSMPLQDYLARRRGGPP